MSKHTPTQWKHSLFDKCRIFGSDGNLVAATGTKRLTAEDHANAAYIVKACNAFPALVEALERIQDMFVVPESGFLLEKYQDLRAIGAEMSRVAENALHSLKSEG